MKKVKLYLTAVNDGEKNSFVYPADLTELEHGFLMKYTTKNDTVSMLYHMGRLTVHRTDGMMLRLKEGAVQAGKYAVGPFFSAVTVETRALSADRESLSVEYIVDFEGERVRSALHFTWEDC